MNPEQWLSLKWNGGSTMSDRWLNQSKIIHQEKFEVYIFYICILQGKRKKWIKRKKGYLEKIKKMFPSDSEIDHYFREIFL